MAKIESKHDFLSPCFLYIKDKEEDNEGKLYGGGDSLVNHSESTPASVKKMEEEVKKEKEKSSGSIY